jgi:hypothetical protein
LSLQQHFSTARSFEILEPSFTDYAGKWAIAQAAATLHNIGAGLRSISQPQEALKYLTKLYRLCGEVGDRAGVATTLIISVQSPAFLTQEH